MDSIVKLALGLLAMLLAVLALFYFAGNAHQDPITLLNSTTKIQDLGSYSMVINGTIEINVTKGTGSNGTINTIAKVYKNNSEYRIDTIILLNNGVIETRTYYLDNKVYACAENTEWSCIDTQEGTQTRAVADILKKKIFDAKSAFQTDMSMLNEGSLVFLNEPYGKTIGTMSCYQLESAIDISKLSNANRNNIELRDDAVSSYNVQCIDTTTGVVYYSYDYTVGDSSIIATTTNLTNVNLTGDFTNTTFELPAVPTGEYGAGVCNEKNRTAMDDCFRKAAFDNNDYKLCFEIYDKAKQDDCFLILVPALRNPSLCTNITSPDVKDSCYTEAARVNANATICDNVVNSTLKAQCLAIANMPPIPSNSTVSNSTIINNSTAMNSSIANSSMANTSIKSNSSMIYNSSSENNSIMSNRTTINSTG